MIVKASAHKGAGLAEHLLDRAGNERVEVTGYRGLSSGDVAAAVRQFRAETTGTRAKAGMIHVSMSPHKDEVMNDEHWQVTWGIYEREFGLEHQAYIEVLHEKDGRCHRHRVYQRVTPNGIAIRLNHSYPRNEKVARMIEYELGHKLTPSRHGEAVSHYLKSACPEIAEAIKTISSRIRPTALKNHNEQQQEVRTGVRKSDVVAIVAAAWQHADSAAAFATALSHGGLRLAAGNKTVQVVDERGGAHDLRRTLRAAGTNAKASDIRTLIPLSDLPSVSEIRHEPQHRCINGGSEDRRTSGSVEAAERPPRVDDQAEQPISTADAELSHLWQAPPLVQPFAGETGTTASRQAARQTFIRCHEAGADGNRASAGAVPSTPDALKDKAERLARLIDLKHHAQEELRRVRREYSRMQRKVRSLNPRRAALRDCANERREVTQARQGLNTIREASSRWDGACIARRILRKLTGRRRPDFESSEQRAVELVKLREQELHTALRRTLNEHQAHLQHLQVQSDALRSETLVWEKQIQNLVQQIATAQTQAQSQSLALRRPTTPTFEPGR
jgi:hypothetical protein